MNSSGTIAEERIIEFYDGKRLDELCILTMSPLSLNQEYKNRVDRLYNR